MSIGVSMQRWSKDTRKDSSRAGRDAQGTLQTVRDGAAKLDRMGRDLGSKLHRTKKTAKHGYNLRRRLREWHKKEGSTKTCPRIPRIIEHPPPLEDSLPSPSERVRRPSDASSTSTIRRRSVGSFSAPTSSKTSFGDMSKQPESMDASPADLTASSSLQPTAMDKSAGRPTTPTKTTTWPRSKTEEPLRENISEEEKEIRKAKDKFFTSHISEQSLQEPKHEVVQEDVKPPLQLQEPKGSFPSANEVALLKERMKMRYSPVVMTRSLETVEAQRARSGDQENAAEFIEHWENDLLPELARLLDKTVTGPYSINIRTGKELGHRIIDVMTNANDGKKLETAFEKKKDELFPADLSSKTTFEFRGGKRRNCVSTTSPSSSISLDPVVNGSRHTIPLMGDSVGSTSEGCGGSATVGPTLKIDNKFYRLLNWHTFDDGRDGKNRKWTARTPPELHAVHPSPDDLKQRPPAQDHIQLGKTVAYSGLMYQSRRVSRSMDGAPAGGSIQVITDWVLCEAPANEAPIPNQVRRKTVLKKRGSLSPDIVATADPVRPIGIPAAIVFSTGRSSGYTEGKICLSLGYSKLEDGTVTRDWAIESINPPDQIWNLRQMGIEGDSGAGIVDKKTNRLIGQLWGRNCYDENPNLDCITYFTAMSDIYDDIQERFLGGCSRPVLPGERPASDARGGEVDRPLQSGLQSIVENVMASCSSSFEMRSSARRTFVRGVEGKSFAKDWVIFNHANTWPTNPLTA
ncbi:hypothetical protein AB5N19_06077 [Seiridium cardinale]